MKTQTERRKNMKKSYILAFSLFAMILLAGNFVLAVDFNQAPSSEEKATFDQILQPVMKIYNLVKYVASAIAGLVLLFAGITYMISGADPKKRENAKSMAMYVIIGLVVIWAAPLVVQLIVS
jgi:type IV secretory pathway VirB2 component (pilin)